VIELSNSTTVARVQDALSHGKSMRYHMASQCVITWQVNALSHGKSMRHHMASQCVITWQVNALSHGKSMRYHMASQPCGQRKHNVHMHPEGLPLKYWSGHTKARTLR